VLGRNAYMRVVRLSVPRSGGTLIGNYLNEMLECDVEHTHNFEDYLKYDGCIVVTYRDPLDVFYSYFKLDASQGRIQKHNAEAQTIRLLKLTQFEFKRFILFLIYQYRIHNNKYILLRYEDCYNNYDYIYDEICRFFSLTPSPDERRNLERKYHINAMKLISESIKDFDKTGEYYIHGSHISDDPSPGSFMRSYVFSKEIKEYIYQGLQSYRGYLGYMKLEIIVDENQLSYRWLEC
jgi:hypothetical protein